MTDTKLVVVGAGPKALAIAAKRKVLAELGWSVPKLLIIEKSEVAALWTGAAGYTDGDVTLGTPGEKDVGFPYESARLPVEVDAEMLRYSWHQYLARGQSGAKYGQWVDEGRPHPSHREWADYLKWVAREVDPNLMWGELTDINTSSGHWRLTVSDSGEEEQIGADALVMTGPGEPKELDGTADPKHPDAESLFNGRNFWKDEPQDSIAQDDDISSIGVIGAGETAAAVVVRLLDLVENHESRTLIRIINREGVLYSRGENFYENHMFTNPDDWENLTEEQRRTFIRRTDRSVFSQDAMERINGARNVQPVKGYVKEVRYYEGTELIEAVPKNGQSHVFNYVVVATGFDPLWFKTLMSSELEQEFPDKKTVEKRIQPDLSDGQVDPKLHLPMLAGFKQGPGFPNLSCLGETATRILRPYVSPP